MKFVCDDNLGRLARWLRTLGFDTVFRADFSDNEVFAVALNEQRAIITRDSSLAGKTLARDLVLLSSTDPLEQLTEVLQKYDLVPHREHMFTICPCCNKHVEPISKEEFVDFIPPYVFHTIDRFTRCTVCARIFWRGTHVERMIDRLQAAGIIVS